MTQIPADLPSDVGQLLARTQNELLATQAELLKAKELKDLATAKADEVAAEAAAAIEAAQSELRARARG